VADSLPAQRKPLRFACAASLLPRIRAWLGLTWDVLWRPESLKKIRLHDAWAASLRFAVWTCVLCACLPIAFEAMTDFQHFPVDPGTAEEAEVLLFVWAMTFDLLLFSIAIVAAFASGFGARPVRRTSTLVFLHTAWLWPITLYIGLIIVLPVWRWRWGNLPFDSFTVSWTAILFPIAFALYRLARALRQVRYAST
jgi:hypothetical protein